MNKFYTIKTTLEIVVQAESPEKALEIANEELMELNDVLADHFVTEWSDPVIESATQ